MEKERPASSGWLLSQYNIRHYGIVASVVREGGEADKAPSCLPSPSIIIISGSIVVMCHRSAYKEDYNFPAH